MIDSTSYGRLLKQRLQELTEKVSDIDGALRETDSPDGEERATENEDDEVLEDLGNAALNEISRINAALHRIKNGTYGVCTSCGGMINEARLVVLLPFPMLNSASHISGLALFLTLFRSLDLIENLNDMRPRMFWLVGLLVAGIASLRAHYLAAATVTVVAFLMIDMWRHRDAVRARMISLFHAGGASVVFLLPWMATLWQSSSTPMYPVFPGTHRPDYENYSAPLGFSEHLSFFGDVMISPGVALFAVPVILYAFRRASLAGLALYLGALVTTAVLSWVFTYSDAENIHRYVAPFLNAAFFATVSVLVLQARAALPTGAETIKHRRVIDAVLCGAIVFLFPVMVSQDMARLTDKWGKPTLPAAARACNRRCRPVRSCSSSYRNPRRSITGAMRSPAWTFPARRARNPACRFLPAPTPFETI